MHFTYCPDILQHQEQQQQQPWRKGIKCGIYTLGMRTITMNRWMCGMVMKGNTSPCTDEFSHSFTGWVDGWLFKVKYVFERGLQFTLLAFDTIEQPLG